MDENEAIPLTLTNKNQAPEELLKGEAPMGRVKGRGNSAFQFSYITPFPGLSRVGEYLFYYTRDTSLKKAVLCRVTSIEPIRYYPDELLSNPQLDPQAVASFLNYSSEGMELYEGIAQIIGYYEDSIKSFINPRQLPHPGDRLYYARKEDLSQWLFRYREDEPTGAHIGYLMNRLEERVPVVIDISSIVSTHLAILAATGAGKSYLLSVILEEMCMPKNRAAIIIFDPHGEYTNFIGVQTNDMFKDETDGYVPDVVVYDKEQIHIKFSELDLSELYQILPDLSEKMKYILTKAWNRMQQDHKSKANFNTPQSKNANKNTNNSLNMKAPILISSLENALESLKEEYPQDTSSIEAVQWRIIKYLRQKRFIDDYEHIDLKERIKPGHITIFNLSEVSDDDQQLIASVILNKILKGRILYKNSAEATNESMQKIREGVIEPIEYPVFVVLEEGHRFAPSSENSLSKKVLKTILSEGRKFGVGVGIVSQRPGKLDPDVLSQCMSQVILKITNPVDQANIKTSVESISEDLLAELPGLTTGQAVVLGNAVNSPVLIQVKKRILPHKGASYNAVKEWRQGWKKKESAKIDLTGKSRKKEPLY